MYYLAIDIGASSGRHILGWVENGKLELEEIHRFTNEMVTRGSQLCWDTQKLFDEIITGLAKCKCMGKIPKSIGIDTWGVDFVLMDAAGSPIGEAVAYRDGRTNGMDAVLDEFITERELYAITGTQKLPFNTIYQLLAVQRQQPELLQMSSGFLLVPEYFNFLLTGKRMHEYTNATTTGLVNAHTNTWDFDLIDRIKLPRHIFGKIAAPGTKLGRLQPEIAQRVGFDCDVVLPCTHDTGSAVVCAPVDESSVYLSSGTWSLIGTELDEPITTEASRRANLTNEGGYKYRYRFLKNIMGLWIVQRIKAELDDKYSFAELAELARGCSHFTSSVEVNDHRFIAPDSMIHEIKSMCAEAGQAVPDSVGELTFCVYASLADSYASAVAELEALTGKKFHRICIIGGGSQNVYLNELTAKACAREVTAGPAEGTAAGNILVQMIAAGELCGVEDARQLVKKSGYVK